MDENNAIFQQFLLKSKQRRRKRAFYFEEEDNFFDEDVQQDDMLNHIAALAGVQENKPPRKVRTPDKDRETRKHYWDDLYRQKTDDEFKTSCVFHMQHATFDIILNTLRDQLILQPTNWKPYPTSPDRQLALSLYRLAHGVSYSVLEDVCSIV